MVKNYKEVIAQKKGKRVKEENFHQKKRRVPYERVVGERGEDKDE